MIWWRALFKKNNPPATAPPHLIKDEEAKMVKAWKSCWGWGGCLFGSRPETSVSVCSDDIIFLLSHISAPLLSSLSSSPHFLLTQHWVNDWLIISLKLHAWVCEMWALFTLTCESLLLCQSPSSTWNMSLSLLFFQLYLAFGGIISHAGPLLHQRRTRGPSSLPCLDQ